MLELEYLRPKNNNKSIINKLNQITKEYINVPIHAKKWVNDKNNLNPLKKRIIALNFDSNTKLRYIKPL